MQLVTRAYLLPIHAIPLSISRQGVSKNIYSAGGT